MPPAASMLAATLPGIPLESKSMSAQAGFPGTYSINSRERVMAPGLSFSFCWVVIVAGL
jgi:hypothetical protein